MKKTKKNLNALSSAEAKAIAEGTIPLHAAQIMRAIFGVDDARLNKYISDLQAEPQALPVGPCGQPCACRPESRRRRNQHISCTGAGFN